MKRQESVYGREVMSKTITFVCDGCKAKADAPVELAETTRFDFEISLPSEA